MTDQVTVKKWAGNAVRAETQFFGTVARAMEQFNNGNRGDLYALLCVTHGRKSKGIQVVEGERMKFAPHVKRLIAHAGQGVDVSDFVFNAKEALGVKCKATGGNVGFDKDKIEGIKTLGKATVQSKVYKDAFPPIKRQVKAKTPKQTAEAAVKRDAKAAKAKLAEMRKMVHAYEAALKNA